MAIDKNTVRNMLLELGVGDFNATMAIPYMFIAPRATDPSAVQLIVVIEQIQQALGAMGAPGIVPNGSMDDATGNALATLLGPEWIAMPYYEIIRSVVAAERANYQFVTPATTAVPGVAVPMSGLGDTLSAIPDAIGLPSVPGGVLTYGLGAYLLYKHFKKARR
jgi:hypothetical protein